MIIIIIIIMIIMIISMIMIIIIIIITCEDDDRCNFDCDRKRFNEDETTMMIAPTIPDVAQSRSYTQHRRFARNPRRLSRLCT